jgi:CO dehydrogenase maturation factor
MIYSIALAGKGGTGKTTVAGLLIKYLIQKEKTPILAVDADSNANLNEVLGLEILDTLGQAREDMKKGVVPSGMTKDVFMSMRLQQAVIEADEYDLIVMGQPEGQGCYCAANILLTNFIDKLAKNYSYIVMDNEAGMEHISRFTTNNVDLLLLVSDTSKRGIQAAIRIHKLAKELNIGTSEAFLIINKSKGEISDVILDMLKKAGLNLAGAISENNIIYEYDLEGMPTTKMPDDSPAVKESFAIFDKIVK